MAKDFAEISPLLPFFVVGVSGFWYLSNWQEIVATSV